MKKKKQHYCQQILIKSWRHGIGREKREARRPGGEPLLPPSPISPDPVQTLDWLSQADWWRASISAKF